MSYLLDTCFLSETVKLEPALSVLSWLRQADEETLHVSALTLGELEKGVTRLSGGARKAALARWVEDIRASYSDRILDVTADVALEWGRAAARCEARGEPLPVLDGLIAATAVVRHLTVVTRNTSHFVRAGARVLNPWE